LRVREVRKGNGKTGVVHDVSSSDKCRKSGSGEKSVLNAGSGKERE
jgi:hypothetical protein